MSAQAAESVTRRLARSIERQLAEVIRKHRPGKQISVACHIWQDHCAIVAEFPAPVGQVVIGYGTTPQACSVTATAWMDGYLSAADIFGLATAPTAESGEEKQS